MPPSEAAELRVLTTAADGSVSLFTLSASEKLTDHVMQNVNRFGGAHNATWNSVDPVGSIRCRKPIPRHRFIEWIENFNYTNGRYRLKTASTEGYQNSVHQYVFSTAE